MMHVTLSLSASLFVSLFSTHVKSVALFVVPDLTDTRDRVQQCSKANNL